MKDWLRQSFFHEDRTRMGILLLLALLLLLLFFLFMPFSPGNEWLRRPAGSAPLALPPVVPAQTLALPPKILYLTDHPSAPPVVRHEPVATPTPMGGGILRKLAFASNRTDGRYLNLYLMSADGTQVERLTSGQYYDRDPHFSFDGQRLAFSSNRTGTYQLYTLDLDTRAVRQLTTGPEDKTNPFWSPDNNLMLYTVKVKGSGTQVGLMNADGSDAHPITEGEGDYRGYGFMRDGQSVSIAATSRTSDNLLVFHLGERELTNLVESSDITYVKNPVFSPVENKMIYLSDTLQHHCHQLYVFDLNLKTYYRLTGDAVQKKDPIYSPDGTRIAYASLWNNAWNIFVMNSDGTHVENITQSHYDNIVPTWR